MSLMTGEQYIESIRRLNLEIYMFGKRINSPVDAPILRPSLNSVRMTCDLAQIPEYEDLMTAVSPPYGEEDQSLYPHPPIHGGLGEKSEDATPSGPEEFWPPSVP